ncbi:hypothetical protein, partial [Klebsiella pneumoniae]|uniref:hypothetical protein n=1 Tax=Klebsiella pneumoniae TaxID=573 RepID=UPI001954CBF4
EVLQFAAKLVCRVKRLFMRLAVDGGPVFKPHTKHEARRDFQIAIGTENAVLVDARAAVADDELGDAVVGKAQRDADGV